MPNETIREYYLSGNRISFRGHKHRVLDAYGKDVYKLCYDFVEPVVSAADTLLGWTTTLVEAGAGESTVALDDLEGGVLLITTDANENDGVTLQLTHAPFKLVSPVKFLYFGTRLKMSDVTQSDLFIGLGVTDTTPLGGIDDGVYFEKLDGAATYSFVTEKSTTEEQTDTLGTAVDDTYDELEFYADIVNGKVYAYLDGTLVATHTTNIPDDVMLKPTIQWLAGAAAAKALRIDWLRYIAVGGRDDQS